MDKPTQFVDIYIDIDNPIDGIKQAVGTLRPEWKNIQIEVCLYIYFFFLPT